LRKANTPWEASAGLSGRAPQGLGEEARRLPLENAGKGGGGGEPSIAGAKKRILWEKIPIYQWEKAITKNQGSGLGHEEWSTRKGKSGRTGRHLWKGGNCCAMREEPIKSRRTGITPSQPKKKHSRKEGERNNR